MKFVDNGGEGVTYDYFFLFSVFDSSGMISKLRCMQLSAYIDMLQTNAAYKNKTCEDANQVFAYVHQAFPGV